jgi:hypothetical protein
MHTSKRNTYAYQPHAHTHTLTGFDEVVHKYGTKVRHVGNQLHHRKNDCVYL